MKAEKKIPNDKSVGPPSAATAPAPTPPPPPRQESWRETIESIVIAFILAFLFRTFEAEAFVIPTGSMAPTLFGQHRDVTCERCGTRFSVGANVGTGPDSEIQRGSINAGNRLKYAVCPNAACHYVNDVLGDEIFAGDRILVNKFPYEFSDPVRWDVVVFKYPDGAKTNYIKRLVGLPGEELHIRKGDIWVRKLHSDDPWRLARKPIEKQAKLQLIVHDNDRPAKVLLEAGWPESWRGVADSNWVGDPEKRSFRIDPSGNETDRWQTLRYTHYIPQPADWNDLQSDRPLKTPMPQVVRDEYAYNMRITKGHSHTEGNQKFPTSHDGYAEYWVGDLTLSCELHPESAKGEIQLELVEGVRKYRCQFDLATGQAQLSYPAEMGRDNDDDVVLLGPAFESKLTPGKPHQVRFCNVDDRLVVWVDDVVRQSVEMELDPASIYQALAPSSQAETPEDRSPIAVSVRGAAVRVAHLLIERDTYYTDRLNSMKVATEFELNDYEDDNEDQFLMLGDNSPRSNDGRGWREPYSVPRKLLIGKAFCIYWPHAVPFLNNGKGYPLKEYQEEFDKSATPIPRISLPFVPQVGRMKRIW